MFDRVLKTFLLSTVKFGSSRAFGIRNKVINASNMLLKKVTVAIVRFTETETSKPTTFLFVLKSSSKNRTLFRTLREPLHVGEVKFNPG